MNQTYGVAIPIEHLHRVHVIQAESVIEPDEVTLRELVEAVAEYSDSEREVVATVMHMLRTGVVKLHGVYEEPEVAKLCG